MPASPPLLEVLRTLSAVVRAVQIYEYTPLIVAHERVLHRREVLRIATAHQGLRRMSVPRLSISFCGLLYAFPCALGNI